MGKSNVYFISTGNVVPAADYWALQEFQQAKVVEDSRKKASLRADKAIAKKAEGLDW